MFNSNKAIDLDDCKILPEQLMSISGGNFSQTSQDSLIITVTLLRHMLQNLPELHTPTHIHANEHTHTYFF